MRFGFMSVGVAIMASSILVLWGSGETPFRHGLPRLTSQRPGPVHGVASVATLGQDAKRPPLRRPLRSQIGAGADARNRTADLLITNQPFSRLPTD